MDEKEEFDIIQNHVKLLEGVTQLLIETKKREESHEKTLRNIIAIIIISFTTILSVFFICYFFSSYTGEIQEKNSNYNYNENINKNLKE